eukprot:Rhum_TRINITY_DN14308_c23_g1::Rhum_TRINITY_DN14308_c23_g1_i1::g.80874::m.80874
MPGGASSSSAAASAAKAAVLELRRLFQTGAVRAAAAAAAATSPSSSPCLPVSLPAHARQHYAELAHNVSGLSATAGCDLVADRLQHLARLLAARRTAAAASLPAPPAALFSQLAQGAARLQAGGGGGGGGDELRRLVSVVADGYAQDGFADVPLHLAALTCHSLATLGLWQPTLALCHARVRARAAAFAHRPAAEHTMVVHALHLEAAGGGGGDEAAAAREACRRSVRGVVLGRLREQLADAAHPSPYSGPQLCFLAAHVEGAAAPAVLLLVRGFGALLRGVAFRDLATLLQAPPPAADVAAAVLLSDASPLRRVLKGCAAGEEPASPPPTPTAAEVASLASFLTQIPNEVLRDLPRGSGAEAVAMKYAFLAEAARGCARGEGRLAAAFAPPPGGKKRRRQRTAEEVDVALRVHAATLAALQPAALAVCADAWRGRGGAAKQRATRVLPAGGVQLLRTLAPLVERVGRLGGGGGGGDAAADLLPSL